MPFVAGQLVGCQFARVDVVAGLVGTLAVEVAVFRFELALADVVQQTVRLHNVLRVERAGGIVGCFDHCGEVEIVAGVLFHCRNLHLRAFA